jgi:hypothetical protein
MHWDTSDDYAVAEMKKWWEAWLHRGIQLKEMDTKDAYAVAVQLRSRLENLGFLKEDRLQFTNY